MWINKIFSRFLNLFKNKKHVFIRIDENLYKNKEIMCYIDLYNLFGVMSYIEDMVEKSEFKKFHNKNIRANSITIKKFDDFIRNNLIHTKNKYSKIYKEKYLLSMAAIDALQWAPFIDNSLENDIIKIILPESKDFVKVTKEML